MLADRYAVIGHGISYSRSPEIHARFAIQARQAMTYGLVDAPADAFLASARRFFASGGRGLNVTVPFKQEALACADTLTPRAHDAGAVNTLALQADGTLLGDNTDGAGLVRDLGHNLQCRLAGARPCPLLPYWAAGVDVGVGATTGASVGMTVGVGVGVGARPSYMSQSLVSTGISSCWPSVVPYWK